MSRKSWLAGAAGVMGLLASQHAARAAACSSLPDPIVVAGSTAIRPFIIEMSKKLAGTTTLIYQSIGSCTGTLAQLADATPTGACATGACIKGTGTYYDMTGAAQTCDLDAAGTHMDVAVSDVFASTCTEPAAVPAGFGDFQGAVADMLFVVPKGSTQVAITAEEAYLVFGFGTAGYSSGTHIMPWVDEMYFFIRNMGSGTQQMIGHSIGVPAGKMKGKDTGGSQGVNDGVSMSTMAEKSIGILASDFYDQKRDMLKALAFRGYDQKHAYFADSTATSFDKYNVRTGHYLVQGPFHMITTVDGAGAINNAKAKRFVDWVQGNPVTPAPPFDIVDVSITAHLIPSCAMQVQRSKDGGDFSLYAPDAPCGCYFESKVDKASASCTACTSDATCGTGKCRRGFCEKK